MISAEDVECDSLSRAYMLSKNAEYCPNCSNEWDGIECYECGHMTMHKNRRTEEKEEAKK